MKQYTAIMASMTFGIALILGTATGIIIHKTHVDSNIAQTDSVGESKVVDQIKSLKEENESLRKQISSIKKQAERMQEEIQSLKQSPPENPL